MRSIALKNIVVIFVTIISSVCYGETGYPLRNGDFSNINRPFTRKPLHDWNVIGFPHRSLTIEQLHKRDSRKETNMLIMQNSTARRNLIFQDVYLPAGDYEFTAKAEIAAETSITLRIGNLSKSFQGIALFRRISTRFKVSQSGDVRIHILYSGSGRAAISDLKINIIKVEANKIELDSGLFVGAIVIPEKPSAAERYAAFELQKYISKITGKTVGLKGRDKTYEGIQIRIAKPEQVAEYKKKLQGLPDDSYLLWNSKNSINLIGNNDRGVLYAAYDFLKAQGCGWYWPGPGGEVVPKLSRLKLPANKIEKPDWNMRTIMRHWEEFDICGVWWSHNKDAYFDWAVRNRLNTVWLDWATTSRLSQHRGGSHYIHTNHSYFRFWLDKNRQPIKAEWAPLVNFSGKLGALISGRRLAKHTSGRVNIPCLSNAALRQRTVEVVLAFFKKNPDAISYGVNADDEPAFWCECKKCRKLDPDRGKSKWKTGPAGRPKIGMANRVIDFVNYVAEKVAKVYPDKFIEVYSYSSVTIPPVNMKVHPNIIVRVCAPPAYPISWPMDNNRYWSNRMLKRRLDGWKSAGVEHFALYDYGNYYYPDSPLFWFYHIVDSLRFYNQKYGFKDYVGENNNNFMMSMMAYNLRAKALWNSNLDYKKEIKDICLNFYGPAHKLMASYYAYMEQIADQYWKNQKEQFPVITKKQRLEKFDVILSENTGYLAMKFEEYSVESMQKGGIFLQKAWALAKGNVMLQRRLAPAMFAHNYMTYIIVKNDRKHTPGSLQIAENCFRLCKKLQKEYNLLLTRWGYAELKNFYFPPLIKRKLYELPIRFLFKVDPNNLGVKEEWFSKSNNVGWSSIRTDKFWTRQGVNYHGVAWYAIKFKVPADMKSKNSNLAVLFGAIDGYADIYLDGKLIGQQKEQPLFMWDKPFAISLPDNFDLSAEHVLVVMVKKLDHAAGIWKPVSIVELQ